LRGGDLRHTIFGHIGDNHVHVNILPRNDEEATSGPGNFIIASFVGP
jgi:D-lactate dehydrogenase (cytochrome)